MKCNNCSTENMANAKFCKKCGKELNAGFKTCSNGHNYATNLSNCPYCPSNRNSGEIKTVLEGGSKGNGDKTVVEGSSPHNSKADKTQIVGSPPSNRSDKTMLISPDGSVQQSGSQPNQTPAALRRLVGWLVTFDIQPTGMDFRLYVGRHIIGKSPNCDIVINKDGVSKEHAVLLYRDGKFMLQDQLSVNGTFVNDVLIEDKVYLNNDDQIRMGNVTFTLKVI